MLGKLSFKFFPDGWPNSVDWWLVYNTMASVWIGKIFSIEVLMTYKNYFFRILVSWYITVGLALLLLFNAPMFVLRSVHNSIVQQYIYEFSNFFWIQKYKNVFFQHCWFCVRIFFHSCRAAFIKNSNKLFLKNPLKHYYKKIALFINNFVPQSVAIRI